MELAIGIWGRIINTISTSMIPIASVGMQPIRIVSPQSSHA
jgi:hypothetical protein